MGEQEDLPSTPRRPQLHHRHPAPLLGALELATFRGGPFICLSGFHEVALGDEPDYDPDDFSSEDSDGETPASARAASASAASKKNKKGRPTANDGGGGGGSEQQRARRREGKKAAAAEEEAREELEEDEEQEHWVHCDRCSRWRVVPSEFWPSVENDPRPHWFCEWARWDVRAQPPYEAACPQR